MAQLSEVAVEPTAMEEPVFRALADGTRRRLLLLLQRRARSVQELASRFPEMSRPAVSKHLKILKQAGLVVESREGRQRFYRCREAALGCVETWLDTVRSIGSAARRREPVPAAASRRTRSVKGRIAGGPSRPARPNDESEPLPGDDWCSW